MLITIERVLVLKSVTLFSHLPDDELARLAAVVKEVEVRAGERILDKGDLGAFMYVVADGKVRVHHGDATLAELGARTVFGELAVLDPEVRSASVTAVDDTLLFRLDQDALYEVMSERPEVTRGIVRFLCGRVRSRGASP